MNTFTINANEYLSYNIQAFYHTNYTGYGNPDNPTYLNDLKNTFNNYSTNKLNSALNQLRNVLEEDLVNFNRNLTICIVPRSKAENSYKHNQLLFKKVIQEIISELNFQNGSDYIVRHTDTRTTHLNRSGYGGDGDLPYPGITQKTCHISNKVHSKNILLIDDIYTNNVNIDEDVIQALYNKGAKSVQFYSIGKTI
jgi:hypothetical protein